MDKELIKRLNNLNKQNDDLAKVRASYLLKEAERKHYEATLVSKAPGKSHAEKVINAQATKEWLMFHVELAALEGAYEFNKLKYDILDKAYLAEHLSLKVDSSTIQRQL